MNDKDAGNGDVSRPAKGAAVEQPPSEGRIRHRARPRTWPWMVLPILVVVLVLILLVVAGMIGIYDGLKDRASASRQIAEEHFALGLEHLQVGNYEFAIAEFELAQQFAPDLPGLRERLQEAKDLAQKQATPTSETRQEAAALLYRQAVPYYQGGNLVQAIAILEELREVDSDYQPENVKTMLTTAYYQLGLTALQEDRLDDAARKFEAVLTVRPDDTQAQEQLNLLALYRAALSYWDHDWSATIQALKGLYTLAPDYKDVRARLHNAYAFRAQASIDAGDWCQAARDYAGAAEAFPLEATVDRRDDAALRCQATAEAPTTTPTSRATVPPSAAASAQPGATAAAATPTPKSVTPATGRGRIAFTRYDGVRQRYDVYLLDLDSGKASLLRENASQPALSPGGNYLAFHNHEPSHEAISVLRLATNEVRDLTAHVEDAMPTWSPDASQIAFASDKHGDRKWRIYGVASGEVRSEGVEWILGRMPAWSPAGSRIAYQGCDLRGDNCALWVMQAGGLNPTRLTGDPSDTAPAWSPDGSEIAFVSSRADNWELYVADLATRQVRRLTDHAAADVGPAWSPDGRQIAFLSNRDGKWAIWILDLPLGSLQKVFSTGDNYPNPLVERLSWIP
jgi:tetratricopeptide (TPR) repeat protein